MIEDLRKKVIFVIKLSTNFLNPAVWNPPASAGGGMRYNPREVALFWEPLRLLPEGLHYFLKKR